jgi:hypothetical protein
MAAVIFSRRVKVSLLLVLLVLISGGVGFFLGLGLASAVEKKKDDPVFWNESALKSLERLQPSDAQRERFQEIVGKAVDDLTDVRNDTLQKVYHTFGQALDEIEKELTPEQKEKFNKMKPTKEQITLDLLKKVSQRRKKDEAKK